MADLAVVPHPHPHPHPAAATEPNEGWLLSADIESVYDALEELALFKTLIDEWLPSADFDLRFITPLFLMKRRSLEKRRELQARLRFITPLFLMKRRSLEKRRELQERLRFIRPLFLMKRRSLDKLRELQARLRYKIHESSRRRNKKETHAGAGDPQLLIDLIRNFLKDKRFDVESNHGLKTTAGYHPILDDPYLDLKDPFYDTGLAATLYHPIWVGYTGPAAMLHPMWDDPYPDNDLAIGSSEKGVVCQPSLGSNGSVETPIHQQSGGLVSSGGPDHPAATDNSSLTPTETSQAVWLVASAAAHHMTGDVNLLTDYTPTPGDPVVHVPNMGPMRVLGSGFVSTPFMSLRNVSYIPGLDKNLVSTSQLTKLGYTITFGPSGCRITKDDEDQTLVGKAHFTDDYLFELDFLRVPSSTK